MAFPLRDVRYVSRRAADQPAALHPRLVRDRAMLPKIDIAIQYFESMLGHERRELDTEVLVHFFGDHKLARCMVAALARSYRFRARTFRELVDGSTVRHLRKLELDSPRALRLAARRGVQQRSHPHRSHRHLDAHRVRLTERYRHPRRPRLCRVPARPGPLPTRPQRRRSTHRPARLWPAANGGRGAGRVPMGDHLQPRPTRRGSAADGGR